ncbi:heparinase II/III domain-containing protein [Kocuria sp.]|uniref:heparinase II/III domain-containing protein n=1 Tax=Kocuria sp. TaxID=1871328 RepID=UPI0026DF380B|nr:heparinase II/III family protein [Kocuria sp.]MDO5617803.1 heparinase II/III family protein [Kocuria sp.]
MSWDNVEGRTNQRYVHGFLFLADWHTTVLREDAAAVEVCADMLGKWATHHPVPAEASQVLEMAFHDETTAQRALHASALVIEHWQDLSSESQSSLAVMVEEHAALLASDWFYAGQNNHGMFQDFALVALALAAESTSTLDATQISSYAELAAIRLTAYFTESFTSDGVHTENSPGYHLMAARCLRDALPVIQHLLPHQAVALNRIYAGAEEYAVHSILPNGRLAPLSDTKQFKVWSSNHSDTFLGNAFRSSMTCGRYGTKPAERVGIFPEAGYAIYRSRWSDPHAIWLLFKAGYRANYHHHCDDLSLLYYKDGDLVLSEAGPFGYEHQNPLTRYAFSQWAHNNIVVDGRSLTRVDPEPGGVSFRNLTGQHKQRNRVMEVQGVNRRRSEWTHKRTLTVTENWGTRPQTTDTSVVDQLTFADQAQHRFECLWHAGPGISIEIQDGCTAQFLKKGQPVLTMAWTASTPMEANILTGADTNPPRSARFPTFGKVEPGAVLSLAGRGAHLDMTTRIT